MMMKRYLISGIIICLGIFAVISCIDPYNPSTTTANPGYLVVDGFLNTSDKSCTIKLTHTVPLNNKDTFYTPPVEANAIVQIEDSDGTIFPLIEGVKGVYSATGMNLDETKNYRLKISTKNQKQYVSDLVPVVQTPPIDSLTFGNERTGVHIDVTTHDATNKARYYMWTFTETWNYEAGFASEYTLNGATPVLRPFSFFNCYKSDNSVDLLLSSSIKLENDIITEFPLTVIPWSSPKLRKKYSIEVTQESLTKEGYEYWQQVKKNTENLGTLFGPLPSTIIGNIQCVTDPSEPVIGYFSAGSIQKKRIFTESNTIRRPADAAAIITGYEGCEQDSAFFKNGPISGTIVNPIYSGLTTIGWTTTSLGCADCRYQGGVLEKPDFWE